MTYATVRELSHASKTEDDFEEAAGDLTTWLSCRWAPESRGAISPRDVNVTAYDLARRGAGAPAQAISLASSFKLPRLPVR